MCGFCPCGMLLEVTSSLLPFTGVCQHLQLALANKTMKKEQVSEERSLFTHTSKEVSKLRAVVT